MDTTLTPEHIAMRIGKLTASRVADATAKLASGKYGASRATYMGELIAERLTGVQAERFVNKEMLWGIDTESQAKAAYEWEYGVTIEPMLFVDHPSVPMSGASPDGAIGEEDLIEIKCPNTATHIEFLLYDEVDLKYRKQMMWQLACTGRKRNHFASFDPRMPPELQLRVRTFERDEKMIAELEKEAREFVAELESKVAALRLQMERLEAA